MIAPQGIPTVKTPTFEDSKPVSSNIDLIQHPTRLQRNLRPLPSFADLTATTGKAESSNCVFEQERCFVDEPLLNRDECDGNVYAPGDVALVDSSDVLLHANNVDGSWENFECYSMPCGTEPLLLPNYASACQTSPPYSDIYHLHPDEYT